MAYRMNVITLKVVGKVLRKAVTLLLRGRAEGAETGAQSEGAKERGQQRLHLYSASVVKLCCFSKCVSVCCEGRCDVIRPTSL